MNHWLFYLYERLSPLSTFLLIVGVSLSCAIIDRSAFDPANFIISCLAWFFLTFYFRLSNDLSDSDIDKVAYPQRPFPRGLVQKKEAEVVLRGLETLLVILGVAVCLYYRGWSALLVVVIAGYIWLIRHHFYLGKTLDRRPVLKTLLHQGILLPMILLSISFSHPRALLTVSSLSYAFLLLGAFLTNELCRKLNPFAHPAAQSLIHFFGFKKIFRYVVVSLLISAIGAVGLGVGAYLAPIQFLLFVFLVSMFKNPKQFETVQKVAKLSLILHAWAGFLKL